MKHKTNWFLEVPILAGITLLVAVCIPLLAVVGFFGRFVLLGALSVGAIAFAVSPRLRRWLTTRAEEEIEYKGLRLGTDVALSPAHAWARVDRGEIVVGADDMVQATLGPVEYVDLPRWGARFEAGDRLFSLSRGGRSVEVRAPVAGTVRRTNDALRDRPGLVNSRPFQEGWAVRLESEEPRRERAQLLRGTRAWDWFRSEADRLVAALVGGAAPSLADGGAFVPELYQELDDETWARVSRDFFGSQDDAPDRTRRAPASN